MKRFFWIFIILFTETYCQTTVPPGTIICDVKQTGTCMGGCDLQASKKCSKASDCYDGKTYFDRYPQFSMHFYCDLKNSVCCRHSRAYRFDVCHHEESILARGQNQCPPNVLTCTNDFGQRGTCLTDRLNSYCCPDRNTTEVLPDFKSNTECDDTKPLPLGSSRNYCRDGYVYSAAETLNKNAGKTLKNCQINSNCTTGEYCMRNTPSSPLQCYFVGSQKSEESSAAGTIATVVLIILTILICAGAIVAIIFLKLAKWFIGVAVGVCIVIIVIILIVYCTA
ncbi:unnamed protein product [Caenorhabditis angaria]|uniref:Domain of unknown function DX domain-containing protein n=1 Tax=Caenorhabditis angaria TaxID=860376 RepID=A0A9P1IK74_9PELO|nr:unnamed protein product [Caenorhabditis angaria]